MTKDVDIDKICTTLDKLTLDTLTLMEEHVQLKLNLENSMNDGILNLAKTRYIMGHNNISSLQLPAEDSSEIEAIAVIHSEENEKLGYRMHDLEVIKKSESNSKIQDPLKWFGVLVPQNLHIAQNRFKQALIWIGEIANIQSRLNYNCNKLEGLRQLKNDAMKTE
ncbi:coiled-coil domain-containing protein [Holotrichia oblita]|uniref:Coiled-coil domain-containing protein n=2 Tax=Holotrichia oblita TaxID=644536 RepID=A0ACB9SQE0_HOLOL|nr:coiled-coil domain-containing protein [Holotrichia oblita]KAI4456705.1 coiled-coil domain-containing protein [Holotrichia oblita]